MLADFLTPVLPAAHVDSAISQAAARWKRLMTAVYVELRRGEVRLLVLASACSVEDERSGILYGFARPRVPELSGTAALSTMWRQWL